MIAKVWTDGCILRPNPGGTMGWAARIEIHDGDAEPLIHYSWGSKPADPANTNQVAEMMAVESALIALELYHAECRHFELTSDSEWCVMQLRRKWKRNVYHAEWAAIEERLERFYTKAFNHCRGHMKSGDWRNEITDRIAGLAARDLMHEEDLQELVAGWLEELSV